MYIAVSGGFIALLLGTIIINVWGILNGSETLANSSKLEPFALLSTFFVEYKSHSLLLVYGQQKKYCTQHINPGLELIRVGRYFDKVETSQKQTFNEHGEMRHQRHHLSHYYIPMAAS
jgi:hypothetical protein